MSACPNCHASVASDVGFCPSCGTKMIAAQPAQPVTSGALHCPQCKSTNFSPINETSIDGALSASRGRMSSTKFAQTHRNYWMCAHCGTKFRNIQSLEEEIVKTKKQVTVSIVFTLICLIVSIFAVKQLMDNPWTVFLFGAITLIFVIATLVSFFLTFSYKSKIKKMKAELNYLKINCFN